MGKCPRTMYIGTYYHTIETAGRVSVPAAFRPKLGNRFMASAGVDGNINLFSSNAWESAASALASAQLASSTDRDYLRLQMHQSVEAELDEQGRVLIPELLRERAKLQKHVVFAGSLDHVELWDRETYHSYMKNLESRAVAVSDAFAERHHA